VEQSGIMFDLQSRGYRFSC